MRFAGGHSIGDGLYHFGRRLYAPRIARWTQPHPLNQPTDLRQVNRYAYAAGDPVNDTDTSGLAADPDYEWGFPCLGNELLMGAGFALFPFAAPGVVSGGSAWALWGAEGFFAGAQVIPIRKRCGVGDPPGVNPAVARLPGYTGGP